MNAAEMISGPLIGALIGYFTNYIAVKMLFLPRKKITVFGHRLPFTPGIIPRRRDELARAVAQTVENRLFPKEALAEMLLSDDIKNTVAMSAANAIMDDTQTLGGLFAHLPAGEKLRTAAEELLCDKITAAITDFDIGALIVTEGKSLIREKLGVLGAMFVTDELMDSIASGAAQRLCTYLEEHRKDVLLPAVRSQMDSLAALTPDSAAGMLGIGCEDAFTAARTLYERIVRDHGTQIFERISIADEVEKRICSMSVREMETLILSVMKRELQAIVNLGALVGFLLGLLNLLF